MQVMFFPLDRGPFDVYFWTDNSATASLPGQTETAKEEEEYRPFSSLDSKRPIFACLLRRGGPPIVPSFQESLLPLPHCTPSARAIKVFLCHQTPSSGRSLDSVHCSGHSLRAFRTFLCAFLADAADLFFASPLSNFPFHFAELHKNPSVSEKENSSKGKR